MPRRLGRAAPSSPRYPFHYGADLVVVLPRRRSVGLGAALRGALITLAQPASGAAAVARQPLVVLVEFRNVATRTATLWWLRELRRAGGDDLRLIGWCSPGWVLAPWGVQMRDVGGTASCRPPHG